MRLYVLLVLVVVAAEARSRRRFDFSKDEKFEEPKLTKLVKPHFNLDDLHENVDDLGNGQSAQRKLLGSIHNLQEDVRKHLKTAVETEKSFDGKLDAIKSTVDTALKFSREVLKGQERILDGQHSIAKTVSDSHQTTRREIEKVENNIRKGINQVSQNQRAIQDKIKEGRSKALNSIESLLRAEAESRSQIKTIQKALEASADANAKGQDNIVDAISDLENTVQGELNEVKQKQGIIFKALDASQNTVEKLIGAVSVRQENIISEIKESRNAVQYDLVQLRGEQVKTQQKAKETRDAILHEVKNVEKNEAATQHILDKCQDSKCDVSKTLSIIHRILKQIGETEHILKSDIGGILSSESKTQSSVQSLEKNVLKKLSERADNTLHEMNGLEETLDAFLSELESDIRDLSKGVSAVENAHGQIDDGLKSAVDGLARLSFVKIGVGSKH